MYARTGTRLIFPTALFILLSACAAEHYPRQEDFRFPIVAGNIEQGRASFIELQCHRCHTVSGVELPAWRGESPVSLELGGTILYVKTYGELVTSIINPNHVLSEKYLQRLPPEQRRQITSPMPFASDMTIAQLVDVVTFLNSRYVLLQPAYSSPDYLTRPDYR